MRKIPLGLQTSLRKQVQKVESPTLPNQTIFQQELTVLQKAKHQTKKLVISLLNGDKGRIDVIFHKLEKKALFFNNIGSLEISFPLKSDDSIIINISHRLLQFRQLQELAISSMNSKCISNKAVFHLSKTLTRFQTLKSLKLDFSRCNNLTDQAIVSLAQGICNLKELKRFSFFLSVCDLLGDRGLVSLGRKLAKLPSLEALTIGMNHCFKLSDNGLIEFADSLTKMTKLIELDLNFYMSSFSDDGIVHLSKSLSSLHKLTKLKLFFSSFLSPNLQEIGPLSLQALSSNIINLQYLNSLSVKLGWSDSIDDSGLRQMSSNFAKLPSNLKELELGLYFCKSITDEGLLNLTENLHYLKEVKKFNLNIWSCQNTTEAGIIKACLNANKMSQLDGFELNSDCLGCRLFYSRKDVLDFATKLLPPKETPQEIKKKTRLLPLIFMLAVVSIILLFFNTLCKQFL